jgi:hypothetical protein
MPTTLTCPDTTCRRQLRVPDELLGQCVKCPRCGKVFTAAAESTPLPAASAARDERALGRNGRSEDEDDYDRPAQRPRRRDYLPHRGTTILVCGILSVVTGLGFIFGPMAWAMGNTDLHEIRAGRMDPEGEGAVNAGRICGMIGTVLGILTILSCFLGFAAIWLS